MVEFEINTVVPNQPVGWLEIKLPKTVMMRLQSYIETAKKNPINWNYELAGNISKSLSMEDKDNWFFQTILVPAIEKFVECYPSYTKEKWERIWMPQVPPQQSKGKSEIELERDKQYETKWVWYHTVLAVELFACSVLLLWIAIVLTIGLIII